MNNKNTMYYVGAGVGAVALYYAYKRYYTPSIRHTVAQATLM